MDRRHRLAYEKELALLKERAGLFAKQNPTIAARLGGLVEDNLDPAIAGLLEGVAFLTARLQVEQDAQNRILSSRLLDFLMPDTTAPVPSAMIVQAKDVASPQDLREGISIPLGSEIGASFKFNQQRVACTFRLSDSINVWPIEISKAQFHANAATLKVPKSGVSAQTETALSFTLNRTDPTDNSKAPAFSTLDLDRLPVHFLSPAADSNALYAHLFCAIEKISINWVSPKGGNETRYLPLSCLQPIGFDLDAPLYGESDSSVPGLSHLVEYFTFPQRFLGFELVDLERHLQYVTTNSVEIVLEFNQTAQRLATRFDKNWLGLYCAAAVNLFRQEATTVRTSKRQHKYLVSADKTPQIHYEVRRILSVRGQQEGRQNTVNVLPLYAPTPNGVSPNKSYYFDVDRSPRDMTNDEQKTGRFVNGYHGTQTHITIHEPSSEGALDKLFVSTECSNRHVVNLVSLQGAEFTLTTDTEKTFACVAGPSAPREAIADLDHQSGAGYVQADAYWRLVSAAKAGFRGLAGKDGTGDPQALRDLLRLFCDPLSDVQMAHIDAISDVEITPKTSTIRRAEGFFSARGMFIEITFDNSILDAGGAVVLGTVLDRFLSSFASVNSFTQTQIQLKSGRVLKRFEPRLGNGPLI